MARPPRLKRLSMEQFPEADAWFGEVVAAMNPFFAEVGDALSGNLTEENLKRQTEATTVKTGASLYATFSGGKVSFKNRLGITPKAVSLAQARPHTTELFNEEVDHVVGATGEPGFESSWLNYGSPYASASFYKSNGRVWLSGEIHTGTIGQSAFTLPAAYRPATDLIFPTESNGAFGQLIVGADGTVKPTVGSNAAFSLCGVSFRSATGSLAAAVGQPVWTVSSNGTITITYIPGLRSNTTYDLVFVIE